MPYEFILKEDPTAVLDLTPRYVPGASYLWYSPSYGWGYYRYYLMTSTAAIDQTDVLQALGTTFTQATCDRDETGFLVARPAGVAVGTTVTTAYYGFAQVSGIAITSIRSDGSVTAGDYLVVHTADDEADTMAAGEEEQIFAISGVADGANDLGAAGYAIFKGLL